MTITDYRAQASLDSQVEKHLHNAERNRSHTMYELKVYHITGPDMGLTTSFLSPTKAAPGTISITPYGTDVYQVRECKQVSPNFTGA